MQRVLFRVGALVALVGAVLIPAMATRGAASAPANRQTGTEVSASVAHAVSPPVRDMPMMKEERGPTSKPLHRVSHGQARQQPDPVVQSSSGPAVSVTAGNRFAGVGQGDYGFSDNAAPPDPNLAVGDTQIVQWVNESFAVFNKSTGAIVKGPTAGNSLWSSLPSNNGCRVNNDGDPIVQFDKAAQRWVMTQFSVTSPATYHYLQCVAVSQTSDATGAFNLYVFDYGTQAFPDYPKLGVWPDAYYMSYNIFNNGSTFAGGKLCAFDRNAMLSGAASATQQCFQLGTADGGLLPADLDGSTPPPAGSPGLYLEFDGNNASLDLWQFHVDWTNSANTTLTGPINTPVAAFSPACNGGGTCIPQPSTNQKLDSLGDRLMYRLAYRNFGSYEALVVNHSVTSPTGQVGVRWYELHNPTASTFGQASPSSLPVVAQQSTFAPDSSYRWMGSIAMDHVGDIALGYSKSSTSIYPSVFVTGRTPTDPQNTMETESQVKAGGGYQHYILGGLSRWGDYSAMSVDPTDDCTFWYTNEYLKASGGFNWSTTIVSFAFPGCSGTTPTPTGTAATTATATSTGTATIPTATSTLTATSTSTATSTPTATSTSTVAPTPTSTSTSTALAAPTNLTAAAIPHGRINLSWTDNATNETNYYVERTTTPSTPSSWSQIVSLGANTTSYQNSGLTTGTTYYYRVRAGSGTQFSGYSNQGSAVARK